MNTTKWNEKKCTYAHIRTQTHTHNFFGTRCVYGQSGRKNNYFVLAKNPMWRVQHTRIYMYMRVRMCYYIYMSIYISTNNNSYYIRLWCFVMCASVSTRTCVCVPKQKNKYFPVFIPFFLRQIIFSSASWILGRQKRTELLRQFCFWVSYPIVVFVNYSQDKNTIPLCFTNSFSC